MLYKDDNFVAFSDRNPSAPVHLLVVPRNHIAKFSDLPLAQGEYLANFLRAIALSAQQSNLLDYAIRIHNGEKAGQEVFHLHAHVLGYF